MNRLEVNPHRRGGIGEASQGEGIGGQQEAEVVRDKREWNRAKRKNREPQQERGQSYRGDSQPATARQSCKGTLDARENSIEEVGQGERNGEGDQREAAFNQHQRNAILRS